MRRIFWMSLGLGMGAVGAVLVVHLLNEKAQAYTPQGLVDQAGRLVEAVREAGTRIAEASAEREAELRAGLLASEPGDSPRGPRPVRDPGAYRDIAPSSARPGGLRPEDANDPLYDF